MPTIQAKNCKWSDGLARMDEHQLRESRGPWGTLYDAVVEKKFDLMAVEPLGPSDLVARDLAALNHAVDGHGVDVQ
jgi:hypothetical protein